MISDEISGIDLAKQILRILETCPAAILIADATGRISQASEYVDPVFGRAPADFVGKQIDDPDFRFVYPDGSPLPPPKRPIVIALNERTAINDVEMGYLRDGSLTVLSCSASPMFAGDDGLIGVAASFHDVTGYRQTEQALRSREQLLRQFVEGTPAAVAMFDTDMRYIIASKRWYADYHLGEQDIIGRSHYEVFLDIPKRWKEIHRRCLAGATEKAEEDPFIRADGSVEWIKWEIQPWRDETGAIGGIIMFTEVITERKREQEELRESQRYINSVIDSLSAHVAILDSDGVIRYTNRAWQDFAKRNGLKTPPDTIGVNYLTVCDEAVGPGADEAAAAAAGIRDVIAGRRSDFAMEYNLSHEAQSSWYNLRVTRLVDKGRVQVITAHEDVTQVKLASEALRESEEKHRLLVERANDGIVVIQDFALKYVNRRFANMGGYTVDELLGRRFVDLVPQDVLPTLVDRYARRMAGEDVPSVYETVLEKKSGEEVQVEINAGVVPYEGRPADLVFVRDITERKHAEEAIAQSEARYRELLESMSDWVWEVDREGRYTYSSPAIERILGYRPDEMIGRPFFNTIVEEEKEISLRVFEEAIRKGGDIVSFPNRNIHKDGSIRYLETSGSCVFDEQGNCIGMRGIDRDVTERCIAEEEKRTFYKTAIFSLTDGKLNIVSMDEARLLAESPEVELTVTNAEEASSARAVVRDVLLGDGLSKNRLSAFIVAVGEAINNAIKHAGEGIVSVGARDDVLWVSVCDEGPGIEHMSLPRVALQKGFSTKPSLGLGYSLILDASDRVVLYTGTEGTSVIMEKNLREPKPTSPLLERLPDTW